MATTIEILALVMVVAFVLHISFREGSGTSILAGLVMLGAFLTLAVYGDETLVSLLTGFMIGVVLIGGFVLYPEIRRGVRPLARHPLHLIGVLAGIWGLLVGLHALGFPGVRLLRIPGATDVAPVSVQNAVRTHQRVGPFGDAGPGDAVDEVKRAIGPLLTAHARAGRPSCWNTARHVVEFHGVYVAEDRALVMAELASACDWRAETEIFLRRVEGRWRFDDEIAYEDDETY